AGSRPAAATTPMATTLQGILTCIAGSSMKLRVQSGQTLPTMLCGNSMSSDSYAALLCRHRRDACKSGPDHELDAHDGFTVPAAYARWGNGHRHMAALPTYWRSLLPAQKI